MINTLTSQVHLAICRQTINQRNNADRPKDQGQRTKVDPLMHNGASRAFGWLSDFLQWLAISARALTVKFDWTCIHLVSSSSDTS